MTLPLVFYSAAVAGLFVFASIASAAPLALHPQNPHYFLHKGKPTVLITSAEHYGAVLNLDFDFVRYLDALQAEKLNLTRVFTGAYVEPEGAFNIARNTLAPKEGRFISPWARSAITGYANGGNKFDLTRWDDAYFKRLTDFVAQADRRGIVVEMNLFCPFYEEKQWRLSPQNPTNHINGLGEVARTNVHTLDRHGGLLPIQEAMVRKIVSTLNRFDNVYYEICNEPYASPVSLDWQHRMVDVIVETEKRLRKKHLISMNIANGSARISNPHPAVSIFNFHYASPPLAVGQNYGLNKVIGDNETGFRGTNDLPYRVEAWQFLIAGGALYNNLDYSFTVGNEDGTFNYPATQPGGGNPGFRKQMRVLTEFMKGFDFVKMKPENTVVLGGVPVGYTARALGEAGRAYAVYVSPSTAPKDEFSVRWMGKIKPRYSETYTFHTISNDGVRLRVNGQPVIDGWIAHSEREDTATIALEAGRSYDVQLDYFQAGGNATLRWFWSSPSQTKEIVPPTALTPAVGSGAGLTGRYFLGTNFETQRITRTDATLDFNWSERSPLADSSRAASGNQTAKLLVALPSASFDAEWINPHTGGIEKKEKFHHAGGSRTIESPEFSEDIALRIKAAGKKR